MTTTTKKQTTKKQATKANLPLQVSTRKMSATEKAAKAEEREQQRARNKQVHANNSTLSAVWASVGRNTPLLRALQNEDKKAGGYIRRDVFAQLVINQGENPKNGYSTKICTRLIGTYINKNLQNMQAQKSLYKAAQAWKNATAGEINTTHESEKADAERLQYFEEMKAARKAKADARKAAKVADIIEKKQAIK